MNKNTTIYSSNLDDIDPADAASSATHGAAAGVGPANPCVWPSVASMDAAAESLRAFAVAHNEIAFAHLVTASLNDEAFAVARIQAVLDKVNATCLTLAHQGSSLEREYVLEVIRSTDTSRPDGATPRSLVMP